MAKKNVWTNEHTKKYNPQIEGFGNSDEWINSFKERFTYSNEPKKEIEKKYFTDCKTLAELKKSFKELIRQYHPDLAGATQENISISQAIISQYEMMKDKF